MIVAGEVTTCNGRDPPRHQAGVFPHLSTDCSYGAGTCFRPDLTHACRDRSLNYWFNSSLVLRLELHEINGNLCAHQPDIFQVIIEKRLDESTDLISFGAQFSF